MTVEIAASGTPSSSVTMAIEALLLAAGRPVARAEIEKHFPGVDVSEQIETLSCFWKPRGIRVEFNGDSAQFRIPHSVAVHLRGDDDDGKRLTAAGMETLAFIALHQPVTLQDIERFRGVKLSRGIMDALIAADLVRIALRRTDSGRAAAYMTTEKFSQTYGLGSLADLPRPEEIEGLVNPPSDAYPSDAE